MTATCELCDEVGGAPLWRGDRCRVVGVAESGYPGFCRVIWHAHVKEMTDLSAGDRAVLMETVFAVEAVLRRLMSPHKINLASLGNMTPHLHWHVIPRFVHDPHFPQSPWGVKQREFTSPADRGLQARIAAALAAKLG